MNSINYVHKDKNIETKVRFFIDYTEFLNRLIGICNTLEIENHLSLIEKIIFQLENNPKKSGRYIINHLENDLFEWHLFKKKYKSFSRIRDFILVNKQWAYSESKWNTFIRSNQLIFSKLKNTQRKLQVEYNSLLLNHIGGYLTCKHELSHHKQDLLILISLFVSEFRFQGIEKNKLESIIEDALFSNKIQFKDLLSQPKEERYFITRIYNLTTKEGNLIDFNIGRTNFISLNNKKFINLFKLKNNPSSAFINDYLNDPYGVVAIEKIEFIDIDVAFKNFISSVRHNLTILNKNFDSLSVVEPSVLLVTNDFLYFNYHFHAKYSPKKILYNSEFHSVNNQAYKLLEAVNTIAKSSLLNYEDTYQQGIYSSSIILLRQYIESLFSEFNSSNKIDIVDYISTILVLSYKSKTVSQYKLDLYNTIQHKLQITGDKFYHEFIMLSSNKLFKDVRVSRFKKYITTDYERYIYSKIVETKSSTNYSTIKAYYMSIMNESYECRNQQIHTGRFEKKLYIKMEIQFSYLVSRFRDALINETRVHNKADITKIISRLYRKGRTFMG